MLRKKLSMHLTLHVRSFLFAMNFDGFMSLLVKGAPRLDLEFLVLCCPSTKGKAMHRQLGILVAKE